MKKTDPICAVLQLLLWRVWWKQNPYDHPDDLFAMDAAWLPLASG